MFDIGVCVSPWDDGTDSMSNALTRLRVAFQFFKKLGRLSHTWVNVIDVDRYHVMLIDV